MTAEHIIPEGLGGTDYLLAATCEPCRLKTHAFETIVQRQAFWPLRRLLGLQGKGRRPPKTIPALGVDKDGKRFSEQLPPERIHVKAAIPIFLEPPIRLGGKSTGKGKIDLVAQLIHDTETEIIEHAAGSSALVPLQPFGQMLAKIAHCAAVKAYGLDGFIPFLPPVIRGLDDDWPALVGCASYPIKPRPAHMDSYVDLVHDMRKSLLIGHVQLFGATRARTPVYEVLIGQRWDAAPPSRTAEQ